MNSAAKILVPLCLLAAVAAGAFYLLGSDPVRPQPAPTQPQPTQPEQPPTPPPVTPVQGGTQTTQPEQPRVDVRVEADNQSGKDLPQGVTGRVINPNGGIVAGAAVFLLRSASTNPIDIFLANKRGEAIPPVAVTRTGPDGRFRVGSREFDQAYDVRVVTDDYPELQHRGVKIREGDWYDAKDLQLELGLVVQGRLLEEGSQRPIAAGTVYLQSTNAAHSLLATPGREKGLVAQTDGMGFFRFTNAPRDTSISLAGEAQGYARAERLNLILKQDQQNEFDIELARGLPMSGVVVDARGNGIRNAQVTATAISSKVPQTAQTVTDSDGRFLLQALREGPFQLVVSALMYEERVEKGIMAGTTDLSIKLEQRGKARLQVLARNGTPLKDFTVSLKRSFPNSPIGIGNVPEFRDVRVTPRDFDGAFAVIKGIPNGDFVFQVHADRHAKTLSQPFTVTAGSEIDPEVVVQMDLGGTLVGQVVDDRGAPVAGAVVSTDMNGGFAAETEFGQLFKSFMPDRVTKASTRTGPDGRFKLSLLAYGEYMVRVAHPDFCEGSHTNIKVETEAETVLPTVALAAGAVVHGYVTFDGQPTGQAKVQIGPPQNAQPELDPSGQPRMMFMATAITQNDGTYVFPKRVPPGNYQIHASKSAGDNNPFVTLLQVRQTQRDLPVIAGQREIVQNFNIPGQ